MATSKEDGLRVTDLQEVKSLKNFLLFGCDRDHNRSGYYDASTFENQLKALLSTYRAAIESVGLNYKPSANVNNKNLLQGAYIRYLFNDSAGAGELYFDADLTEGQSYTISAQGKVSDKGQTNGNYIRIRVFDFMANNADETKTVEDLELHSDTRICIGKSFVCQKSSHYRVAIGYINTQGVQATPTGKDDYAFLEYVKLEEGAYISAYNNSDADPVMNPNLLPANLMKWSYKNGELCQRNDDGVFYTFFKSSKNKPHGQVLTYLAGIPQVQAGKSYTLSFLARGTGDIEVSFYTETNPDDTGFGSVTSGDVVSQAHNQTTTHHLQDTYKQFSITYSFAPSTPITGMMGLNFTLPVANQYLEIRAIKLEQGGRVTAFVEDESASVIQMPTTTPTTPTGDSSNN